MTVDINFPLIGSIVAAVAGVVGTILTPIYGVTLATAVKAFLLALSTLLIAIPTWHLASVAATSAKSKAAARALRKA